MQPQPLGFREHDDAGLASHFVRGDAEHLAGAADINRSAIGGRPGAEQPCPPVHRPGGHRHAGQTECIGDFADDAGELFQRREPFGGARHEIEDRTDIIVVDADNADIGHRVGTKLAGQLQEAEILGQQNAGGSFPDVRTMARDPEHAGQRMRRVDRNRCAQPSDLLRDGNARIELRSLGAGARILPENGGHQRFARAVGEHMCVDLAAQSPDADTATEAFGRKTFQRGADKAHPVGGLLLGAIGRRAGRWICLCEVRKAVARPVEDGCLDRCGTEVDAQHQVGHARNSPAISADAGPAPRVRKSISIRAWRGVRRRWSRAISIPF